MFRLYAAGAQPAITKLYRPVSYPVGRGTPMLNSKVGWDHSQRFIVPKFGMDCKFSNYKKKEKDKKRLECLKMEYFVYFVLCSNIW